MKIASTYLHKTQTEQDDNEKGNEKRKRRNMSVNQFYDADDHHRFISLASRFLSHV